MGNATLKSIAPAKPRVSLAPRRDSRRQAILLRVVRGYRK
jgi:hypothetical protein